MATPVVTEPWLRRATVAGAIIYGLLGVLSLFTAAMSAMMFDAPGSEDSPITVALVGGLVAAPVILLLSSAWLGFFGRVGRRRAIAALLLPIMLVVYIVALVIVLQEVCGGNFVCKA